MLIGSAGESDRLGRNAALGLRSVAQIALPAATKTAPAQFDIYSTRCAVILVHTGV
jgi:hypothetical protein